MKALIDELKADPTSGLIVFDAKANADASDHDWVSPRFHRGGITHDGYASSACHHRWRGRSRRPSLDTAASVRGPKHSVKRGKTPVLTAGEARQLLDSIVPANPAVTPTLIDYRDRALIAVMVYSFARVSAAIGMQVADYYTEGRKAWFRLYEKGGKRHEVPAHHNAADYVDAYLEAAGIASEKKSPLFRSIDRHRAMTDRPLEARNALDMIKRRAKAIGLPETICCHTFRATGITAYLENGWTIENAQQIANHESPKTTKLYDRTSDQITLDEVERIMI
jgi:integrase/recombinase XerD